MGPRGVLLRAVPVLGQCRLARERNVRRSRRLLQDGHERAPGKGRIHRLDQAHLAARLDDSFDCSHLDAESNVPGGVRKEESTTMIVLLTIPSERDVNGDVALAQAAQAGVHSVAASRG